MCNHLFRSVLCPRNGGVHSSIRGPHSGATHCLIYVHLEHIPPVLVQFVAEGLLPCNHILAACDHVAGCNSRSVAVGLGPGDSLPFSLYVLQRKVGMQSQNGSLVLIMRLSATRGALKLSQALFCCTRCVGMQAKISSIGLMIGLAATGGELQLSQIL